MYVIFPTGFHISSIELLSLSFLVLSFFFFFIVVIYTLKFNKNKSSKQIFLMSFIHTLIYVKVCGSKFWHPDFQNNARSCCEKSQLQIWSCPTGGLSAVTLHVDDDIVLRFVNILHVSCSQKYFYPFPDFNFFVIMK